MLLLRGVSQTIVEGGTFSLGGSPLLQPRERGAFRVARRAAHPVSGAASSRPWRWWPHTCCISRCSAATCTPSAATARRPSTRASTCERVETMTYVISSGLGGVAGICYAAYIGQMSQQVGVAYELYAISAAVLGGLLAARRQGTVLGIVIGSAIMRVIDNGINMFQIPYVRRATCRADLAPQPELDVHHRRRRDPAGGDPRPGRAPVAVDTAHARGAVNGDANSRRESDERAVRRNAARVFPQGRTPSSVSAARTSPPTSAWSRAAWARCTERRIRGSIAWRLRPRNAEGLRSVPVRGFGGDRLTRPLRRVTFRVSSR